jgi:hypothetical protein
MSERLARVGLIQLEVNLLMREAERSRDDVGRLAAIREEMTVLVESLEGIRREQLLEEINPQKKKRRWWQRG